MIPFKESSPVPVVIDTADGDTVVIGVTSQEAVTLLHLPGGGGPESGHVFDLDREGVLTLLSWLVVALDDSYDGDDVDELSEELEAFGATPTPDVLYELEQGPPSASPFELEDLKDLPPRALFLGGPWDGVVMPQGPEAPSGFMATVTVPELEGEGVLEYELLPVVTPGNVRIYRSV